MAYSSIQPPQGSIDVVEHAFLVKRIAQHMIVRMPASVQLDDLIQAGMIGLLEAAQKFDGGKGASFETYAGIRIRGAIVDEMRRGDWVPRSVHRNSRRINQAIKHVEGTTGRDASDAEIAAAMDVSLEEYHSMASDSASGRLFSLEQAVEEDEDSFSESTISEPLQAPAKAVQRQRMQQALSDAIDTLPEREKMVLSLYYEEEMNLKEIGLVLGVSESRISQIHSQAALRLKKKMTDWHSADVD